MDFFDKKVFNKRFYALSDSSSFAFSDSKPSLSSHMGPQLESVPMKTVDDVPNNDLYIIGAVCVSVTKK